MKPLLYNPATGSVIPTADGQDWTSQDFRTAYPTAVWYYNPWTGVSREVLQGPYGLALSDEGGIYNPVEKKMETKEADYRPEPMRFVSNPVIKHLRFDIAVAETSAEVINLLSAIMAMYPNITNAERGAVVSWFCERYRN